MTKSYYSTWSFTNTIHVVCRLYILNNGYVYCNFTWLWICTTYSVWRTVFDVHYNAHIHTLTITRTHSHFHSHLHIVIHTLSFTLVRHMLIITHSNHSDRANSHTFSHTFYKTHILIHFHPTILLDPTTYSVPHVFVFALSFNHSFRHPSTDQWSKWCTLYRVQCKYRIL